MASCWQKFKRHPLIHDHGLTICTCIGVFIGMALGSLIRFTEERWHERDIEYLGYIGQIYIGMLRALILPLVVSSLISALGNMDLSLSGTIGSRAVIYYMLTTVLAIILGIFLVVTIQPGSRLQEPIPSEKISIKNKNNHTIIDTFMDLMR